MAVLPMLPAAAFTAKPKGIFGASLTSDKHRDPSTAQLIVGSIGDALQQWGGGRATFAPEMAHRREAAQAAQQAQLGRAQEYADRVSFYDYQRAHPHPQRDDEFTRSIRAAGIDPASREGQELYRRRVVNMTAPPLMAVDGFDAQGNPTKTFIPRSGFGGGAANAPAGPAIGTVRHGFRFQGGNPYDRNSWVPVGGAPSAGGATFR